MGLVEAITYSDSGVSELQNYLQQIACLLSSLLQLNFSLLDSNNNSTSTVYSPLGPLQGHCEFARNLGHIFYDMLSRHGVLET